MPFTFNGNTPEIITYNGNDVEIVTYNGVVIWTKEKEVEINHNGQILIKIGSGAYAGTKTISMDTSSIPSTASIISCTLEFKMGVYNVTNNPPSSVGIYQGTSTSGTLLVSVQGSDIPFVNDNEGSDLASQELQQYDVTEALSDLVKSQSSISIFFRAYINNTLARDTIIEPFRLVVKYK